MHPAPIRAITAPADELRRTLLDRRMHFIPNWLRQAALALALLTLAHLALELRAATNSGTFIEETIGGTWNEAVGLTFSSDGQMFVWERAGRVWPVENGIKQSQPLIDLSPEVGSWHDHGLMGFALHPDDDAPVGQGVRETADLRDKLGAPAGETGDGGK